jgi:hypothetical protein
VAALLILAVSLVAIKAERDGKTADDVVGNRLSVTGNRFEIRSKDDASTKPDLPPADA